MVGSVEHVVPGDCNIGGSTLLLGVGLPSPPAFTLLCWFHFLASHSSILLQLWELILPGSSLVEINYSPICQQPQWKVSWLLHWLQLSHMSTPEQITGSGGLWYCNEPGLSLSIPGISHRVNSIWSAWTDNGESVSFPRKNQDTELKRWLDFSYIWWVNVYQGFPNVLDILGIFFLELESKRNT